MGCYYLNKYYKSIFTCSLKYWWIRWLRKEGWVCSNLIWPHSLKRGILSEEVGSDGESKFGNLCAKLLTWSKVVISSVKLQAWKESDTECFCGSTWNDKWRPQKPHCPVKLSQIKTGTCQWGEEVLAKQVHNALCSGHVYVRSCVRRGNGFSHGPGRKLEF